MPKLPEKYKGRSVEGKDKMPVLRIPRHGKGKGKDSSKSKSEMKNGNNKSIHIVDIYAGTDTIASSGTAASFADADFPATAPERSFAEGDDADTESRA